MIRREFREQLYKSRVLYLSDCDDGAAFFGTGLHFVIWTRKPDMGTIAHEAFHVTAFAMRELGSKIKGRDNEMGAYFIGWITEEIGKDNMRWIP